MFYQLLDFENVFSLHFFLSNWKMNKKKVKLNGIPEFTKEVTKDDLETYDESDLKAFCLHNKLSDQGSIKEIIERIFQFQQDMYFKKDNFVEVIITEFHNTKDEEILLAKEEILNAYIETSFNKTQDEIKKIILEDLKRLSFDFEGLTLKDILILLNFHIQNLKHLFETDTKKIEENPKTLTFNTSPKDWIYKEVESPEEVEEPEIREPYFIQLKQKYEIPKDLIDVIIGFIPGNELIYFISSCKTFYEAYNNLSFWGIICQRDWGFKDGVHNLVNPKKPTFSLDDEDDDDPIKIERSIRDYKRELVKRKDSHFLIIFGDLNEYKNILLENLEKRIETEDVTVEEVQEDIQDYGSCYVHLKDQISYFSNILKDTPEEEVVEELKKGYTKLYQDKKRIYLQNKMQVPIQIVVNKILQDGDVILFKKGKHIIPPLKIHKSLDIIADGLNRSDVILFNHSQDTPCIKIALFQPEKYIRFSGIRFDFDNDFPIFHNHQGHLIVEKCLFNTFGMGIDTVGSCHFFDCIFQNGKNYAITFQDGSKGLVHCCRFDSITIDYNSVFIENSPVISINRDCNVIIKDVDIANCDGCGIGVFKNPKYANIVLENYSSSNNFYCQTHNHDTTIPCLLKFNELENYHPLKI